MSGTSSVHPAACLVFVAHLPERLRHVRVFDDAVDFGNYVDEDATLRDVAAASDAWTLPAIDLLTRMVRLHRNDAMPSKVSLIVTGPFLRNARRHIPLYRALQTLAHEGGELVELIASPWDHSILGILPGGYLGRQWRRGADEIAAMMGVRPTTGANTEFLYDNPTATHANAAGLHRVLLGYADAQLAGRTANRAYASTLKGVTLLARHVGLSDDLGIRLGDASWSCHPVSPVTFADWVAGSLETTGGNACPLYLHLSDLSKGHTSGLADLLEKLPRLLAERGVATTLPREVPATSDMLSVPQATCTLAPTFDLAPLLGNAMQSNVLNLLRALIEVESGSELGDAATTLASVDHLMRTHYRLDGKAKSDATDRAEMARRPTPYASPYDAYLDHVNAMKHALRRAERR